MVAKQVMVYVNVNFKVYSLSQHQHADRRGRLANSTHCQQYNLHRHTSNRSSVLTLGRRILSPPLLAQELRSHHTGKERHAQRHRLTAKRHSVPRRSNPLELEIDDTEAASGAPHVDDTRDNGRVVGEAVQTVRTHGRRGRNHGEGDKGPCELDRYPVEPVLQCLAKEDQAHEADERGGVCAPETRLWDEFAVVFLDVACGQPIIEPMAPCPSDPGSDDWCCPCACLCRCTEGVWRSGDELWECQVDADDPGYENHDIDDGCWNQCCQYMGSLVVRRR